jgi:hypothetical protein
VTSSAVNDRPRIRGTTPTDVSGNATSRADIGIKESRVRLDMCNQSRRTIECSTEYRHEIGRENKEKSRALKRTGVVDISCRTTSKDQTAMGPVNIRCTRDTSTLLQSRCGSPGHHWRLVEELAAARGRPHVTGWDHDAHAWERAEWLEMDLLHLLIRDEQL